MPRFFPDGVKRRSGRFSQFNRPPQANFSAGVLHHWNGMSRQFSQWPWLRIILLISLALRLVESVVVQKQVELSGKRCLIAGDAEGYWTLARQITLHEDYALYDPPRRIERMPGFPVVLAVGMKLFGANALALRCYLALFGTAACGLVYLLGREIDGRQTGLIAALLAAVSPIFSVFSVLFLSETVFALALVASLIALARLVRWEKYLAQRSAKQPPSELLKSGRTFRRWMLPLLAGLLCGAATLVRPTWILIAPGFCVLLAASAKCSRRSVRLCALLLLGTAAALAPWTIRNFRMTGRFIPTTLWVGPSLYDGLSPRATGDSNMDFVEKEGRYDRRDVADFEFQANEHYKRAAFNFVRRNPRRTIELGFHKFWRYINPFPNAEQFSQPVVWWGVGLFELPLLLLAVWGGWKIRRDLWALLILAGPTMYFAAVHTVFVGSVRYRLPAEYALVILSAIGIRALVRERSSAIR